MPLKSADHVAAILTLINEGTWAKDAIWARHENDEDYDEVALPDRVSRTSGGFTMIEQGRKTYVPNGKKVYADEADFWKNIPRHWPRFPLKKSHWTRDYRRKDGEVIVRRFDLFAHYINAITRELNDEIISIEFFIRHLDWTGPEPVPDVSIHSWSK